MHTIVHDNNKVPLQSKVNKTNTFFRVPEFFRNNKTHVIPMMSEKTIMGVKTIRLNAYQSDMGQFFLLFLFLWLLFACMSA